MSEGTFRHEVGCELQADRGEHEHSQSHPKQPDRLPTTSQVGPELPGSNDREEADQREEEEHPRSGPPPRTQARLGLDQVSDALMEHGDLVERQEYEEKRHRGEGPCLGAMPLDIPKSDRRQDQPDHEELDR